MSLHNRKWLAAILIAVLVITAATGAVYAYLSATGGTVTNTLTPQKATNPIVSISQATTAAPADPVTYDISVDIGECGYAVYARVVVVVTWRDENGNIYAQAHTCSPTYNSSEWFEQDGFHYYRSPISGETTLTLTLACSDTAPDGCTLHVEVISQTIQALGGTDADDTPAVTAAWGVTVVDGNLTPD